MDKTDRDGENKTQKLYMWCSSYALSKLIVDNGLGNLQRRENPGSPQTGSILISMLIQKLHNKINHIMVSFTDHYNAILSTGSTQKLKLEKIHDTLLILFYVSQSSPQLQRLLFFLLKTHKNNHFSANDWWEYTKSYFKQNAKTFSKNSTTQKNILFLRLK